MLKFTANLSMLFCEHELKDRFKAAKEHGFTGIEIQFPYVLSAKALRDCLDENGQKLVLFNVAADDLLTGGEGLACVPHKQEQFKEAVAQAAEYAALLKPEAINVLPGRCLPASLTHALPAYYETFVENLVFAADTFAGLGVKTVFEAINTLDMPGFIIHTGEQMLELFTDLEHPNVFMQYDIYHAVRMGEHPEQFITQNADKIGHIQFADCPGRGQPGTGDIDFKGLFKVIEQSGYTGWVGAEYKPVGPTSESLRWLK